MRAGRRWMRSSWWRIAAASWPVGGARGRGCPGAAGGPASGRRTGPAAQPSRRPGPPPRSARIPGRRPGPQGCARGGPRCGPSAAAVPARTRPRSRSTPRSPPLASYLRPRLAAPGRDGVLVPLRGPVCRDLGDEPETVQQVRHAPRRVRHAEQAGDQRRDLGQRHRWSWSQPKAEAPASSAAPSLATWSSSSLQALLPGPLEASAASPPARQARRH